MSGTIAPISSSVYSVFAFIDSIDPASSAWAALVAATVAARNRVTASAYAASLWSRSLLADDDQLVVGRNAELLHLHDDRRLAGLRLDMDALDVEVGPDRRVDLLRQQGGNEVEPDIDALHVRFRKTLGLADRLEDRVVERKSRDADRGALDVSTPWTFESRGPSASSGAVG